MQESFVLLELFFSHTAIRGKGSWVSGKIRQFDLSKPQTSCYLLRVDKDRAVTDQIFPISDPPVSLLYHKVSFDLAVFCSYASNINSVSSVTLNPNCLLIFGSFLGGKVESSF